MELNNCTTTHTDVCEQDKWSCTRKEFPPNQKRFYHGVIVFIMATIIRSRNL